MPSPEWLRIWTAGSELTLEYVTSDPLRRSPRPHEGADPGRTLQPGSVAEDIAERMEVVSSEVESVLLESNILSIISSLKGKTDVAVDDRLRLEGLRVRRNRLGSGGTYSFRPDRYTNASRLGLLALREDARLGATGE